MSNPMTSVQREGVGKLQAAMDEIGTILAPAIKQLSLPELRHRDSYTGTHRSIVFEISRHESYAVPSMGEESHDCWCYYIYLRQEQVPESKHAAFFPKPDTSKKTWQQYDWYATAFASLPWHGGMTYYHQERHDDRGLTAKAGCDYDHLWDREARWPYSERTIINQVVETIDALWEAHPDLLVRCNYTGDYFPLAEMQPWGDGYISAEGATKKAADDAERNKVSP